MTLRPTSLDAGRQHQHQIWLFRPTDNFHTKSKRTLLNQLGGNDHKSIKLTLDLNQQPEDCKMLPRFNYRKGKWDLYSGLTDRYTENIKTKKKDTNKIVKGFNAAVLKNGTWRSGRRTLRRKLASDKTDPQKIKWPTSPTKFTMPSRTKSIHLRLGLFLKKHSTECGEMVRSSKCTSMEYLASGTYGYVSSWSTGRFESKTRITTAERRHWSRAWHREGYSHLHCLSFSSMIF